jgi:hypothetical protein
LKSYGDVRGWHTYVWFHLGPDLVRAAGVENGQRAEFLWRQFETCLIVRIFPGPSPCGSHVAVWASGTGHVEFVCHGVGEVLDTYLRGQPVKYFNPVVRTVFGGIEFVIGNPGPNADDPDEEIPFGLPAFAHRLPANPSPGVDR